MNMNELIKQFNQKIVNQQYNDLLHDTVNKIMKQRYLIGEGENIFTLRTKDNSLYIMLEIQKQEEYTHIEMKVIEETEEKNLKQKITFDFYKNELLINNEQLEDEEQQTAIVEQYIDNKLKIYSQTTLNSTTQKLEQKQMYILKDNRAFTREYSTTNNKEKYNLINVRKPFIFDDMNKEYECRFDFISELDKRSYKKLERQLKKELRRPRKVK